MKPCCIYAGTKKCYGKSNMDSDSAIGSVGGAQSDPIENCIWLKKWIYCPYL